MIKSLLLGSGAALCVAAGAQAADLPVKAKPVEYVKICSAYGKGFYYIPGTDTCVRISGYMRVTVSVNSNSAAIETIGAIPYMQRNRDYYNKEERGSFAFDVRNNTQYGVMRAYFNEYITTSSQTAVTPSLSSAYLQLAGFTVGRFIGTYNTAWDTDIGSFTTTAFSGRDTSQSSGVEYRAQFGNGVSAAIGLFEPRRDGIYDRNDTQLALGSFPNSTNSLQTAGDNAFHMPDIEGDVRVEQTWGGLHFGALLHQDIVVYSGLFNPAPQATSGLEYSGAPKSKYGYAFNASLNLTQLPTGKGDKLTIAGQYTKGAIWTIQASAPKTTFAIFGPGNNSGFYNSVAFGYFLDSVFDSSANGDGRQHLTTGYEMSVGMEHYWIPTVLHTSLYGGYERIHYDSVAANAICTTITGASRFSGAAGFNCNPDFTEIVVGSRTAWNITPDLEFSGDIMYNRYNPASSGFITANTTMVAGKPQGVIYNIADQGQFSLVSRIIRSW